MGGITLYDGGRIGALAGPTNVSQFHTAEAARGAGWASSVVVYRSRYWPGVTPTSAVKSRVKWAWSYHP